MIYNIDINDKNFVSKQPETNKYSKSRQLNTVFWENKGGEIARTFSF